MKLKKCVCIVLAIACCIAIAAIVTGFPESHAMAANGKQVEIIDTDYTGKELPDPELQFSGKFTVTEGKTDTVLPTPVPAAD